jgi:N-acetylglutamate synthase
MPEIVSFTEEHVGAALALWRVAEHMGLSDADEPERLVEFLRRNANTSFVARDQDGSVSGACLCGHDGRRGYVYHLAVSPRCRRSRVGADLLDACLRALQQAGIRKCHAFIFADNPYAELFWVRSGWQRRDELVVFSRDIETEER